MFFLIMKKILNVTRIRRTKKFPLISTARCLLFFLIPNSVAYATNLCLYILCLLLLTWFF